MTFHNGMEKDSNIEQRSELETLQLNEELHNLITKNITDLIWTMDMDFRFTYMSPSIVNFGGYSVDEAMTLKWADFLTTESLEVAQSVFQEALEIEQNSPRPATPRALELEMIHKNGHYIWAEVKLSFIHNNDGNLMGIIGITRDISKHKEAIDELTHNQRLLLALSQGAKSIQRSKSPEEIYKAIGEETKKLNLETTVFMLNEDQTILSTVYTSIQPKLVQAGEKLTGLSANGYSFSIEPDNFYDQIIQTKEPVFSLHDTAPFTSALPKVVRMLAKPLFDLLNFHQSIIAPLIVEGKVYGLLSISGADLKESDLPAVTTFASQAAVAIENSLLVMRVIADSNEMEKRVRARTEELNTVIDLMSGREVRMAGLKKTIKILRSQLEEAGLTPAANDPLLEGDIEGF